MNKNVMIVLVGGFVIAILVAVMVQASLNGNGSAQNENAPKTEVLVAARDLPVGTTLSAGDLKWQVWPGDSFPGAILREPDQNAAEALTGRLTNRVAAGQPVLQSYVFKEGRGNLVAATLEKGMRAIAIPVKANTMAGGFVSPGDYVDVVLTYQVRINRGDSEESQVMVNRYASETILSNIRVVAVDQEATRDQDKAKIAKTVTLAVDTKGAEKVALASEMGDITLSLRGIGDDSPPSVSEPTTDVQVSRVMQDIARARGGNGSSVRVYSGSALSQQRPRNPDMVLSIEDDTSSSVGSYGIEGPLVEEVEEFTDEITNFKGDTP